MLLNIQELVDVRAIAVPGCDARLVGQRESTLPLYCLTIPAILSYYDDGRRIRMRDRESSHIRWQVARQSGNFVV